MPDVKRFTWDVTTEDASASIAFNAKTISMGDGYEQDISMGINNTKETWNWAVIDSFENIRTIRDFLNGTKGSESFIWESPFGDIRVKASEVQLKPLGGPLWKISGSFIQRYR